MIIYEKYSHICLSLGTPSQKCFHSTSPTRALLRRLAAAVACPTANLCLLLRLFMPFGFPGSDRFGFRQVA
jgi:hypothetical protein